MRDTAAGPASRLPLGGLLAGSLAGLLTAIALGAAASWDADGTHAQWPRAVMAGLVALFLLPALLFLHATVTAPRCPRPVAGRPLALAMGLQMAGGALWAASAAQVPAAVQEALLATGGAALLAGAVLQSLAFMRALPRRESVVDVARDPLSKGDDACLLQATFAHRFLMVGTLMLAVAAIPGLPPEAARVGLAGLHVALVGYAVLSIYAISHLAVPRYSGVPAIAAGAIKGELHSTLGGIVLLAAGFLSGHEEGVGRGLLVAGGAFAFVGAFVFMGVLGANIMKNKSRTQRVTPQFAYIPWTFAGVLWLVCGLLLGWFLNAVPDAWAARRPDLAAAHAGLAILGGAAQLYLGFLPRELATRHGSALAPFSKARWPFLGFNAGLLVALLAPLSDARAWAVAGSGVMLLSAVVHAARLRGLIPRAAPAVA